VCDIDDDDGDDVCTDESHCAEDADNERRLAVSCHEKRGRGGGDGDLMSSMFRIHRARAVSFGPNDNEPPKHNRTTAPQTYNNDCRSTIRWFDVPIPIVLLCTSSSVLMLY